MIKSSKHKNRRSLSERVGIQPDDFKNYHVQYDYHQIMHVMRNVLVRNLPGKHIPTRSTIPRTWVGIS